MVVFFNNVFFFQEREKDLLKFLSKEKEKVCHYRTTHAGLSYELREILTMSFFQEREKDLLKYKEPSSRQCLSQEREKTCYLRWLSETNLKLG